MKIIWPVLISHTKFYELLRFEWTKFRTFLKWMTVCFDWTEYFNISIGLTFVLLVVFFSTQTAIHRVVIKFLSFSNYGDILILYVKTSYMLKIRKMKSTWIAFNNVIGSTNATSFTSQVIIFNIMSYIKSLEMYDHNLSAIRTSEKNVYYYIS